MTVAELLARISSRELSEWMAYYAVEPFGAERDNLHAGIVAAAAVNLWRDKDDELLKPSDFLMEFDAPAEVEAANAEDVYDMMRTWALLNKAKDGNDTEDAGGKAGR